MEKHLPLEEKSISQIYLDTTQNAIYQIPIYQRNYAWEKDEIEALIDDVYDSMLKNDDSPYYIGTLVTYKRNDNEHEVIDGQQRLTTIYLILKAMGINNTQSKLTYTARQTSAGTLKKLPTGKSWDDSDIDITDLDNGIKNGYTYAFDKIHHKIATEEWEKFKNYFLNQVKIIHYQVPSDVDLNHYFEVMNSRGEQLEKHEIVKSHLAGYLGTSDDSEELKARDLAIFSCVWEACSDMNVYIQQKIKNKTVFGNNLDHFECDNFADLLPLVSPTDLNNAHIEKSSSILSMLKGNVEQINRKDDTDKEDKFQSIIDFPNFLLIVLKLTWFKHPTFIAERFTLDDKELLNMFDTAVSKISKKVAFVKYFTLNLLKARFFLDNYIVHHIESNTEQAGDNPWRLQRYSESGKAQNLSDNDDIQKELVHLLSMFEVSFTAKQRKNYLFYCLQHLFGNDNVEQYLEFTQHLADKYFHDVYLNKASLNERNLPKPNAFDNAMVKGVEINDKVDMRKNKSDFLRIFKQGDRNIPLFVFTYTDYKLWKKYADELRGERSKPNTPARKQFFVDLGCQDFGLDQFNLFYFSRTRKSLEHFYPQAKTVEAGKETREKLTMEQINRFGNFAMIGAEANSSGSNWSPKTKLDHYMDSKSDPVSVASLKFRIMMQMCKDSKRPEPEAEWIEADMIEHEEKMLSILFD